MLSGAGSWERRRYERENMVVLVVGESGFHAVLCMVMTARTGAMPAGDSGRMGIHNASDLDERGLDWVPG